MSIKNDKQQLSDYWLTGSSPDLNNLFDLLKMQRAVANFVKIVSGRDIAVEFRSGEEKSNSNQIIISADMSNIDATVGLAIHETLSFTYTTKYCASRLMLYVNDQYIEKMTVANDGCNNQNSVSASRHNYQTKKRIIAEMEQIYHLIEYWRIDAVAVRTAPGYKGYIAECYNLHFQINETIAMFIAELDTMFYLLQCGRDDIIESKFNFVSVFYALLAQAWHCDIYRDIITCDLSVLDEEKTYVIFRQYKAYRELLTLIDINNISRLKNSDDSLNLAIEVWETINKAHNDNRQKIVWEDVEKSLPKDIKLPDLEKHASKIMQAAALDIEKKKISVSHKESLKMISSDSAERHKALYNNRQIKIILLEGLNRDRVYSGKYTFFDTDNVVHGEKAVTDGIRMGAQLARRLQFRNNERIMHFSRLKNGKIDRRLLWSAICDNENLFFRTQEESFPAVNFHISIDGSHSMQGECFFQSIKTAVAIARAGELIKNINVAISFRFHLTVENARYPLLLIAYDSRKDKIGKIKQFFPCLKASGPTPEGLCYPVISEWIIKNSSPKTENYFVNFYDGMPGFYFDDDCCYEGKTAMEQVRNEVSNMRRRDIRVLSYFLISGKWKKEEIKQTFDDCRFMYGDDAKMININELSELANSLNRMAMRSERLSKNGDKC